MLAQNGYRSHISDFTNMSFEKDLSVNIQLEDYKSFKSELIKHFQTIKNNEKIRKANKESMEDVLRANKIILREYNYIFHLLKSQGEKYNVRIKKRSRDSLVVENGDGLFIPYTQEEILDQLNIIYSKNTSEFSLPRGFNILNIVVLEINAIDAIEKYREETVKLKHKLNEANYSSSEISELAEAIYDREANLIIYSNAVKYLSKMVDKYFG